MIEDESNEGSGNEPTDKPAIFFMPISITVENNEKGKELVQKLSDSSNQDENSFVDLIEDSTIVVGTPDDVLDVPPSTATCAEIFRKIGAEVLIYTCSFGGIGVLTGVIMRFAQTPPLLSMLIGNGVAVLSNENARVFFTSLIKPHGEKVPDDKKEIHEMVKKYGAHPISTVLTSTINGSTVSLFGATDLGSRQIIVSITAQMGGITTYVGQTILRKYFKGSITVQPGKAGDCQVIGEEMKKFYSMEPNKGDENRPHLAGNIRNILTRVLGMFLATTGSWYGGVYQLENYCGPGGRQTMLDMHGNFTVDDLNQHCFGGRFTMLLRDWGVTAVGLLGFLVVQPLLNKAFNVVFDYFYPKTEEPDDDVRIVEVFDDEDEKSKSK